MAVASGDPPTAPIPLPSPTVSSSFKTFEPTLKKKIKRLEKYLKAPKQCL
jgi:hypothetical protein